MRIAVVGASGNVGTAVLRRLYAEPSVTRILGVARRTPPQNAGQPYRTVHWYRCDIGAPRATDTLAEVLSGSAAVILLAWQIQPSHHRDLLRRTNVQGTRQVAEAAVRAGVPALVYASSLGAYAPGPKDRRVDESWPVTGVPGSMYSEDKAAAEAVLDEVQRHHTQLRVVRLRPGLIFQRNAAAEITRYFLGPWVPVSALRFARPPLVPRAAALRAQAVHADDVADAYVRAALTGVHGAFNIAAEPVLSGERIARHLGARTVPVPVAALTAAAGLTWRIRLQPTEAGWVRMARAAPLMDCGRAAADLGWRPRHSALDAVDELLAGMAVGAGTGSPALRAVDPFVTRWRRLLPGHRPGEAVLP